MPCNYKDYPSDWKEIRAAVMARAEHRCEFCGLEQYAQGYRTIDGVFMGADECLNSKELEGHRIIRIVLTVAHLDHDTANSDMGNLVLLCQQCHNRYDAKHRAKNAAETRRRKSEFASKNNV